MTHLRRRSRSVRRDLRPRTSVPGSRLVAVAALAGAAVAAMVIACGGGKPPPELPSSLGPETAMDAAPVADAAPAVEPPPPDAPPMTTVTLPVLAQVVTRVKRGKRPAALRYLPPAAGETPAQIVDQSFGDVVETVHDGTTGGRTLPSQDIGSTLSYTAVPAAAGASPSIAVVQRLDRAASDDAWISSLLEDTRGSELVYTIDDRGQGSEVQVTSRAVDTAGVERVVSILRGYGSPILLPAEPVGVGGQWRVVERTPMAWGTIEGETTYTLVARDGDRLSLTGVLEIRVPAHSDRAISFRASAGTGTLTATVDLARPAPQLDLRVRFDAAFTKDGRDQRLITTTEVRQVTRDR